MARLDWDKAKRRKTEAAEPKGREPVPLRGGSHVKPGPVKQWAEMTPAERHRVMQELRRNGPPKN